VEASVQDVEEDRGEDVVIVVIVVTAVTTVLAGHAAATWALAMSEAVTIALAVVLFLTAMAEASIVLRASPLAGAVVSTLGGKAISCLVMLVAPPAMCVTTDLASIPMRSSEMTSNSSTEARTTTTTTVTELISSIDLDNMQTIIIVAITDMDTMGVDQILIST
jgi:hypothetical protein